MTALHTLWADRCLSASVQHLNSSTALRAMGGNCHFWSLIPGCKHLTRACPNRINSSPVKSPSVNVCVCLCACMKECGCALFNTNVKGLSSPTGWDMAALPSSYHWVHNKSLAACDTQRAKLVIKATVLHEKGGGCSVWGSYQISPHFRYQILAWPDGTACHGLMTSVETASVAL